MSGIGFWELIILFLIGLIVLGPERLPRVANQLGGWLGQARRMTRVMKRQLEDELNIEKHLDIVPPDRTRHSNPGTYQPPPLADSQIPVDDDADKDDTYSPAHEPDSVGTGVGDDPVTSDDAGADDGADPATSQAAADAEQAEPADAVDNNDKKERA